MADNNTSSTDTTGTDATATDTTQTQQRTAENKYRFSGETSSYVAYKPSEWTPPKEILFSEFTITETDLRVKTATFKSPHYIDLTKGRACCWIQRKYGDNFGGVILSCKQGDDGLYEYSCQDWNRLLTNKVYVVLNGTWTAHKIISKLLSECGMSMDGLGKIESYDGMNEEVPSDDDPYEQMKSNSGSTSTTTTDSSSSDSTKTDAEKKKEEEEKKKQAEKDKETKLEKSNSFRRKPRGLYDKISARDFILAIIMRAGVNIDIWMDENGVLHFDRYVKDNWLKERWYFVDTDVYEPSLKFDLTDLITQVAVKHVDQLDGEATLYTSEKLLGVNLAKFFGVMGTVIDNPVKSSGGGNVASGDGITFTGKPSAGKCCAKANGGVQPPYKTVTRSYKNYCPNCKKSNVLKANPKGVAEGEITCGACDSDFCICCGYDKNGTCRSRLTPASGGTPATSTDSSSSSKNTGSTATSTTSTDASALDTTSTGTQVAVEDWTKNKMAARIAFSESMRKWFTFTIKLPGEYRKLHTNSFCMFMMSDTFVLENMPTIGKKLNGKFTRYVGYEKNRYYIEKVVTSCIPSGFYTELTLNPFASDYSTFAKTQIQAEEALNSALGGGGSGAMGGDLIAVGNALAAKYGFCNGCGSESYSQMKKKGAGSCFAWSGALYTELTKIGVQCRVVQYATSAANNHRSVEIYQNGQWVDYPYRSTNIPKGARNTSNRNRFVISDATLKSIL